MLRTCHWCRPSQATKGLERKCLAQFPVYFATGVKGSASDVEGQQVSLQTASRVYSLEPRIDEWLMEVTAALHSSTNGTMPTSCGQPLSFAILRGLPMCPTQSLQRWCRRARTSRGCLLWLRHMRCPQNLHTLEGESEIKDVSKQTSTDHEILPR